MKNSASDHPLTQPLPDGHSAVTARWLSRYHPLTQPLGAPVHSAVTTMTLNRAATAEQPSKVRFSGLIFQQGSNLFSTDLAGVTYSTDMQGSSAPGARGLESAGVHVLLKQVKTSLEPLEQDHER
jgi:hypothetical protein